MFLARAMSVVTPSSEFDFDTLLVARNSWVYASVVFGTETPEISLDALTTFSIDFAFSSFA